jgi:hypothetical protein
LMAVINPPDDGCICTVSSSPVTLTGSRLDTIKSLLSFSISIVLINLKAKTPLIAGD